MLGLFKSKKNTPPVQANANIGNVSQESQNINKKTTPPQSILGEDEGEIELTESKVDWNPSPKRMGFLKTIAPIILILSLVAFVVSYFARSGKKTTNPPVLPPVPTIPAFQRYKPSIYADDPVILKLQEDINVLDRELSNTQIKETILEPPVLDFDVTFKKTS